MFSIGTHACVYETLIPFRGRYPFCVHLLKETVKYGIKMVCLTDVYTSYLLNVRIYADKNSDRVTLTEDEKKLQKSTPADI